MKKILYGIAVCFCLDAKASEFSLYFGGRDDGTMGVILDREIHTEEQATLKFGFTVNARSFKSLNTPQDEDNERYQGIPFLNVEKHLVKGLKYSTKFGVGGDFGQDLNFGFYYMAFGIKVEDGQNPTFTTIGLDFNLNDDRKKDGTYWVSRYTVTPAIGFGF